MAENERVVAHQSQEKFQFYSVALTFTILGLSIQTASFDGIVVARFCELTSWTMLLASGLLGMSHLEWGPAIRIQMVRKDELEEGANRLKAGQLQGMRQVNVMQEDRTVPIEERIQQFETYAAKLDEQIKRLDSRADLKYRCSRWTFVAGVIVLAIGRGSGPVAGIAHELLGAA